MNDKERKEFINSIKEDDLDKTATFSDLMSRAERRQHELEKKKAVEIKKTEQQKISTKKKEKQKKKKATAVEPKNENQNLENTRELKTLVKQEKEKKKEKPKNFFKSIVITALLLSSIGYFIYTLLFCDTLVNQLYLILNSGIIMLLAITDVLGITRNTIKSKKWFIANALIIVILILFNLLVNLNILKLPTNNVVKDFTGVHINEAIKWAEANNIKYYQTYEYSDNIKEYAIISQNVSPNTVVKTVKDIEFVVSKGPNYDKEVIISNMVGWNIDDVIKVIDDNFLNNVTINYEFSDDIKRDIVMEQNVSGQLKRTVNLILTVSLGKESELLPVEAIDLVNKSEFKATLWLKRNGVKYEIKYDFSNKIKKGYVINQSIKKGTTINQKTDKMVITISKGSKIKVPNLKNMKVDEIISWVSSNNLKISFEERFDATVKAGSVIEANYKEGDEIEEGTTIKIVTSKGVLKMKNFSSLSEFRTWASRYGVNIREEYEFNNYVKQGEIIKFSHEKNAIINYNDTVTVYISDGKAITIPDFYGQTKANIQNTCNNLGLNCTFYYARSSRTKDTAISQNKNAGSKVIKGTYVNIGLSGGNAYNSSSGGSSSGGSSGNNGGGSTKPSCDTSKKYTIYLAAGETVDQTKSMIKQMNPNFTFNFVTGNPGYGTTGSLYQETTATYHGKEFNNCSPITIKIIQK